MDDVDQLRIELEDAKINLEEALEGADAEDVLELAQVVSDLEGRLLRATLRETGSR